MKQIMLATVASLALSLPAMAAQNNMQPLNRNQHTQMQPMNHQQHSTTGSGNNRQQAQNQQQRINPRRLSKSQIVGIQKALNAKGFNARNVDGIWGPETDRAVASFQKQRNLPGNGRLNRQTLAALGVNVAPQAEQGTVGAGPSTGSMNSNGMNSNQNNTNKNDSSSTNGMNPSNQSGMGPSGHGNQSGSTNKAQ